MYKFIQGTIYKKLSDHSYLVNTSEFGLEVFIPYSMEENNPVSFYLHSNFSTDQGFTFFGFSLKEELNFFQLLTTVPGLGGKNTIKMIHQLGFDTIGSAINKGDKTTFTGVSGIGNKIASRIITDLKNKVPGNFTPIDHDLVTTLVAIGYKAQDITPILSNLNGTFEQKLEQAISILAKSR